MISFIVTSGFVSAVDEWRLANIFIAAISCCLGYTTKYTLSEERILASSLPPEISVRSLDAHAQLGRRCVQKRYQDERHSVDQREDVSELEGAGFLPLFVNHELPINSTTSGLLWLKRILQRIYLVWIRRFWIWCLTDQAGLWHSKLDQNVYRGRRTFSGGLNPWTLLKMTLLEFPTLAWAMDEQNGPRVDRSQRLASRAFAMLIILLRKSRAPFIGSVMAASTIGWIFCQNPQDSTTPIRASFKDYTSIIFFLLMVSSTIAYMYAQCVLYRSCDRPRQEICQMIEQYINHTIAGVLVSLMAMFLKDGPAVSPHYLMTFVPALFALSSFLCSLYRSTEWTPELDEAL